MVGKDQALLYTSDPKRNDVASTNPNQTARENQKRKNLIQH